MKDRQFANLTVGEIRSIVEMDIREIMCGVDIFRYAEKWESIISDPTMQQCAIIGPVSEAVIQMVINLDRVIREYLTYDPQHIPDPLEFYKGIVSKRNEIEDIIKTDMVYPVGDEPVKTDILNRGLHKFGLLGKHLVGVGSVHKFSEEIVRQKLYGDQIRPDEE